MRASGGSLAVVGASAEEESYANEACVEQSFSREIAGQSLCHKFRGLVPQPESRIAPHTKLHLANGHRSRNLRSSLTRKVR